MRIINYTRPKNTLTSSSSSGGDISGTGLPYTLDEAGNYVVNGNIIFNGSEQQWKNEDLVLMVLDTEGLKVLDKIVAYKEDIDKWFYEDSKGNLHSKLNLIGDKDVASYGQGEDLSYDGLFVEVFEDYTELSTSLGINNKIYVDRETGYSYIYNTLKNEFINISQPNTTGAVEEYKDYNTITKSEGVKDKIYIDKEKANMYAYDTDTESYYGIAGGVIAFPKLYLNPKTGKLIMQLPTQDTPNAFKIQNGHLILIQ